jgi:hypothetical protein
MQIDQQLLLESRAIHWPNMPRDSRGCVAPAGFGGRIVSFVIKEATHMKNPRALAIINFLTIGTLCRGLHNGLMHRCESMRLSPGAGLAQSPGMRTLRKACLPLTVVLAACSNGSGLALATSEGGSMRLSVIGDDTSTTVELELGEQHPPTQKSECPAISAQVQMDGAAMDLELSSGWVDDTAENAANSLDPLCWGSDCGQPIGPRCEPGTWRVPGSAAPADDDSTTFTADEDGEHWDMTVEHLGAVPTITLTTGAVHAGDTLTLSLSPATDDIGPTQASNTADVLDAQNNVIATWEGDVKPGQATFRVPDLPPGAYHLNPAFRTRPHVRSCRGPVQCSVDYERLTTFCDATGQCSQDSSLLSFSVD